MSSPSNPDWLAQLIAEEGESKPMDVAERDALIGTLSATQSPQSIDEERHRQIIETALNTPAVRVTPHSDDPFAPPTPEEQAAAARLRDSFESDPLVTLLRSAYTPSTLRPRVELGVRETALARQPNRPGLQSRRLAQSAWGVFAVAAAAALWLIAKSNGMLDASQYSMQRSNTLAVSRSTDSLFAKPFALSSHSERIDKIAQVRSRELRDNRYAIWGLP